MVRKTKLSVDSVIPFFALTVGCAVCIILSFQYVWLTTFPVGNDTPFYISRAQEVINAFGNSPQNGFITLWNNSHYPGAIAIMALSSFIPLSWPERFTVLIAGAQCVTGFAIGWLLLRSYGWKSATIGMIAWGSTAMLNHYYSNGMLAHLLSLIPFLISLERLQHNRVAQSLIFILFSYFLHPMTAMVFGLVIVSVLVIVFPQRKLLFPKARQFLPILLTAGITACVVITGILYRNQWTAIFPVDLHYVSFIRLLTPYFAAFVLMAPLGCLYVLQDMRVKPLRAVPIVSFAFVSLILAFNNLFSISLLVRRFEIYLIVAITLLAGVGILRLARYLHTVPAKAFAASILIMWTVTMAWKDNSKAYAYYEESNYARIHPQELEAISWMEKNLHPGSSVIVTNEENRTLRWLPAITELSYVTISADEMGKVLREGLFSKEMRENRFTHLVIFMHNKPSGVVQGIRGLRFVVFQNESAVILAAP